MVSRQDVLINCFLPTNCFVAPALHLKVSLKKKTKRKKNQERIEVSLTPAEGAAWAQRARRLPALIAMAASCLAFQPWVQKEALLTETLPSLPPLRALHDPPPCRPGLSSTGYCLALGCARAWATLAQGGRAGVSGGPCSPREPPCPSARWQAGWLGDFTPLVAGGGGCGGGRRRKVAFSEGQWWGASRRHGNSRAVMAAWLHPLLRVRGRVMSELIQPRAGRGESRGACKAAGGTAARRRAFCLLAVSWASQGGRVVVGFAAALGPPELCASPSPCSGGSQGCANPSSWGRGSKFPKQILSRAE